MVKFDVSFFIGVGAIVVMLYCLYLVLALRRDVPGGMVGKRWNFLATLVAFFTLGYLSSPFFSMIPEQMLRLIVQLIFFFGAVYVVMTVKLIHRVIQELTN